MTKTSAFPPARLDLAAPIKPVGTEKVCHACAGSGIVTSGVECDICSGTGIVNADVGGD